MQCLQCTNDWHRVIKLLNSNLILILMFSSHIKALNCWSMKSTKNKFENEILLALANFGIYHFFSYTCTLFFWSLPTLVNKPETYQIN
jgi:hypothetical protein